MGLCDRVGARRCHMWKSARHHRLPSLRRQILIVGDKEEEDILFASAFGHYRILLLWYASFDYIRLAHMTGACWHRIREMWTDDC